MLCQYYDMQEILEGNVESIGAWIEGTKAYCADIDETDCNGLNALHYAIIFKQAKLVELLLDSGAGNSLGYNNAIFTYLSQKLND